MSLDETTKQLGKAHHTWKSAEKEKNKLREKFFREATEALTEELPAQSVERVPAGDMEEALRIAQRRFQRHRVVDVREAEEGTWDVVLEENPELRPFTYVNRADGQVYQRIVSEGSAYLDDESLKQENPELWERITAEKTERVMKPLEELDAEDLVKIQPYITTPRPSARLGSPRLAKQEELDEADN